MKSLFPPNGLLGEGLCFWMIHARWVLGCAPITDSPRLLTGTPWVSLLLSERGEFYLSPSHSVFSRRVSLWSQPLFLVRLVKFLTPGWRRLSAETCPPLFPQGRGRGARGHTLHPAPYTAGGHPWLWGPGGPSFCSLRARLLGSPKAAVDNT